MGHSFTGTGAGSFAKTDASGQETKRRVLVTGAGGRIGSYFAAHSHDKYTLRLMVQHPEQAVVVEQFGEIVVGDLADLSALKQFCQGIDTVVHLAGNPDSAATWKPLLEANIIGTYHMMVAAKAAGCRRLIHASSIHAVSGYPRDIQVKTSEPTNPGDLYGVSKVFGEALGRYMAEQEGLSVIVLRIGAFTSAEHVQQHERSTGILDAFVSDRDLLQLIHKCIDVENLQFAIFHGISNNAFKRLDISDARELVGYEPQDDLAQLNPKLNPFRLAQTVHAHRVNGPSDSGLRDDL